MKIETVIGTVATRRVTGDCSRDALGIACDSRQVRPGHVFVAFPGRRRDGWQFVADAVQRGAVAVVSEHDEPLPSVRGSGSAAPAPCHIVVDDARAAVGELARRLNGCPDEKLRIVGITGTNGKTTTAYMVRAILQAGGWEPGLIGTVAYVIGSRAIPAVRTTPEAAELQGMLAQMVSAGCRSAVMEVSSHALDQERVNGIDFDVGVFTNLTRDHLDYHGSMENYFLAKARLFHSLGKHEKRAVAVLNGDDPWAVRVRGLAGISADIVTYGIGPDAAVRAEDIDLSPAGSLCRIQSPWGSEKIRLRLLGRFNVSNALAAIATCGSLGMELGGMAEVLSGMAAVRGRLEQVETGREFQVFVDYAHTDDALEHVLETLREITRRRLIVVFGCGGDRDRTKRPAMGRAAARLADYTVLTSDNPRSEDPAQIIAEIREGFGEVTSVDVIEDRREAIEQTLRMAERGDVVLIAGKGHESFQEFANRTIAFDDREVVQQVLGIAE